MSAVVPLNNTSKAKSRWKWNFLKTNEFFKTTPFAGYSFIDSAKTKKEVFFWYFLMLMFTSITIYNVTGTFDRFSSRPTAVSINMLSTTAGVAVTDLTLTIKLHLFEFVKKWDYPNWDLYSINSSDYKSALLFFACTAADPEKPDDYLKYIMYGDMLNYWKNLLVDWLEHGNSTLNQFAIGDTGIASYWKERLSEDAFYLNQFLESMINRKPSALQIDKLYEEMYYVMMEEIPYKAAYLMTLEALKLGHDPRLKLFDELRKAWVYAIEDFHAYSSNPQLRQIEMQLFQGELGDKWVAEFSGGSKRLLKSFGVSGNQMFKWAIGGFNELFHVVTVPKTEVYLSDWAYNITYYTDDSLFRVTLNLKVPQNTKKLSVKIYSLLLNRFEIIYSGLLWATHLARDIHYKSLGIPSDSELFCNDGKTALHVRLLENMYKSFQSNYEQGMLLIETGRGNSVTLQPFYDYKLSMKTSGLFASQVDNCHNGTHVQCVEDCLNDLNLNHCNCYPWNLYHLNKGNENLCEEPCQEAENEIESCGYRCEQLLKHPCKLYNYDIDLMDKIQDKYEQQSNELKSLFSFTLAPAMRNYPRIMEEYSMTPGLLLSELGGHLDLWMGINVIGFIHFALYIIKQINDVRDPHSRTGQTVRAILGGQSVPAKLSKHDTALKANVVALETRLERLEKRMEDNNKQIKDDLLATMQEVITIRKLILQEKKPKSSKETRSGKKRHP